MNGGRQQHDSILNVIIVGSIAMLLVLDATVGYYSLRDGAADREISFGSFSLLPVFFIAIYAIARRGHYNLASYLVIGGYFLSDSYAAFRWGVSMPVVLLAYTLIIVMTTILYGSRFGFLITGIITLYIIPLWYLQFNGIIATQPQKLRAADGIVFSVLYLLIMTVAWLYNREIARSLARAERSERDLKEERDLLEVKVAERTEELRAVQLEKVEQLSRLAELGRLSSGLFHDVLNLLNAVALRDDERNPSLAHAFDTTKQIERFMHAIRRQIGGGKNAEERFSVIEAIHQVLRLVSYKAIRSKVKLSFDVKGAIAPATHDGYVCLNDPSKFHQVILNLLLNAIESYDDIPPEDKREREVHITLGRGAKNDDIVVQVKDSGCGMSEEVRRRVFEPFFSTKNSGNGIGIGLATAKRIVEEDLGGTIAAQSKENEGSAFTITFPSRNDFTGMDRTGDRVGR